MFFFSFQCWCLNLIIYSYVFFLLMIFPRCSFLITQFNIVQQTSTIIGVHELDRLVQRLDHLSNHIKDTMAHVCADENVCCYIPFPKYFPVIACIQMQITRIVLQSFYQQETIINEHILGKSIRQSSRDYTCIKVHLLYTCYYFVFHCGDAHSFIRKIMGVLVVFHMNLFS